MTTTSEPKSGFWTNNADNHFNEPPDCFERYIDPQHVDLVFRCVTGTDEREMQLFTGKPSKLFSGQVTFSAEELANLLGDTSNIETGRVGSMAR